MSMRPQCETPEKLSELNSSLVRLHVRTSEVSFSRILVNGVVNVGK